MSKFNQATMSRPSVYGSGVTSPVHTSRIPAAANSRGGPGYKRDAKSELFLLAIQNMVGEQTFYETSDARDDRFEHLIHQVTLEDPEWIADFLAWLRDEGNMRSAPLVGAAEATKALLTAGIAGGRQIVASVLMRPEEPGELLAYWRGKFGRSIPFPVRKGINDALPRLYNERNLIKWDSPERAYRMGDVIELTHPKPTTEWRSDLFRHAIDRRHHHADEIPASLNMINTRSALLGLPVEHRRKALAHPELLKDAGMTWESLAGWLQGPMDKDAWEAIIPSMGYMALLRNLRNFDQAGISHEVAEYVAHELADPDKVARSKQFPMRFLSAYRAAPSLRWGFPIETALNFSLRNIPTLSGNTLILVDTSGSMHAPFSKDGSLMRWDAAVIFGAALAQRCTSVDLVSFSSGYWGADSATKVFPIRPGESLLKSIDRWKSGGFFINGGTDTPGAVRSHYRAHDRVVILTDEQVTHGGDVGSLIPPNVPLYTWNLAGYRFGHAPSGSHNRHTFGGLNDACFRMIPLLENGQNGSWPWNQPKDAA